MDLGGRWPWSWGQLCLFLWIFGKGVSPSQPWLACRFSIKWDRIFASLDCWEDKVRWWLYPISINPFYSFHLIKIIVPTLLLKSYMLYHLASIIDTFASYEEDWLSKSISTVSPRLQTPVITAFLDATTSLTCAFLTASINGMSSGLSHEQG